MFKVWKNTKINEKLISNIIPIQNDIKFIKKTSFIIYKENTKQKEIKNDFLKKKIKFQIYNKNESSNQPKIMFLTKKIIRDGRRWSKKEKFKFLEGFYKFGFDWKKINKNISSRTGIQVRSHAQKFLLSLRKFKDDSLGIDFTNDVYDDRKKLLNKIREIINNNEKGNMLMVLTNKLSKKNLLKERINHEDDWYNLNIIHNKDFSEIKEEKSEISEEKNINKILDNNIFVYKSNFNYNINDFNDNLKTNTFVNNYIEYNDSSIDKSDIGFNDSLIINKINYNNIDLLVNEKYFKESEYIQNIEQKNITYIKKINKKYIINKKEALIDYQLDY